MCSSGLAARDCGAACSSGRCPNAAKATRDNANKRSLIFVIVSSELWVSSCSAGGKVHGTKRAEKFLLRNEQPPVHYWSAPGPGENLTFCWVPNRQPVCQGGDWRKGKWALE